MSFKATTWAASVKTRTPTQKLILLLLANKTDDDGICSPSINRIADDACMSRSAVIENIKKLAANGFIDVTRRTEEDPESGAKRNASNLYRLNTQLL